jgi:hypothetical protein
MTSTELHPDQPAPGVYIPGYARIKLLMIVAGMVPFLFGVSQLWTPLHLLAFGQRATAEVTGVIKTKAGVPDLDLTDSVQLSSHLETTDRSYIFWNEFRFETATGRVVELRAPVGSQLKPLYPLLDYDGFTTTSPVFYDPAHPEHVVFPLIISTWFFPGMFTFIGLLCMTIGSVLLYWANRPIELPHVPPL